MKVFKITENELAILLKDFNTFITYLNTNEVTITKANKYISNKYLYEINSLIDKPEKNVTIRSNQLAYPMLHLFYNLVVSSRLFQEDAIKGSKIVLKATDRFEMFENLTNEEKYISLLEALFVDCNFENLRYQTYDYMDVYSSKMILKGMCDLKANEKILCSVDRHCSTILLYLSYFGIIEVKENQQQKEESDVKRCFIPESIKISEIGLEIIKILSKKRDLEKWNIPYRKEGGEWKIKFQEPFYKPFEKIFDSEKLEKTLPRSVSEYKDGLYTFKVSLNRGVWAKIQLSSHHTLENLHNSIQSAFDFDNDHLYSFFMDGKRWSHNRFTSPYDDEGPHVDEVKIGELALYEKQKFIYIFDYGDEWTFNVEVDDIEDSKVKLLRPQILESKGEAPNQYAYYDDEDDE